MRKIPTLFKREFEGHKIVRVLPEVIEGMEWVLDGDGIATVKYDGSCCVIIDGKFYVRQDIIEDCPRTFEGIRDYLRDHYIEGIVFWKDGEPKCKIKRSDFGFEWQPKKR